jgi:CCR4-NOT complex subunit CAF16
MLKSVLWTLHLQFYDMAGDQASVGPASPSIEARSLNFAFPDGSSGLSNVSLSLPAGSRALLIGANGAGKTTLLRLLSGKRMAPSDTVLIAGIDPFKAGLEGVTYLGLEWVLNPIVRTDIDVPTLLASIGGNAYPERRDQLVGILDIDTKWRMHTVSDGERRRVQLAMGLLRPWSVLLLDEITVDLDLLSRRNFLQFLRLETESRACTIVYATHILDNLADWPTHLVHMSLGKVKKWGAVQDLVTQSLSFTPTGNSQLGELVLQWLQEDLDERGPRNKPTSQGKTYQSYEGLGGYGAETKPAET